MSDTDDRDDQTEDFDPESRRLCPDDNCIGVIGPDGKCKECGTPSPDGPPPASAGQPGDAAAAAPDAPARPAARAPAKAGGDADEFDPEARTLCSDDTCTGLIGADGTCKECGKPYAG